MSRLYNILNKMITDSRDEIKYSEFNVSGQQIAPGAYLEVVIPVTIPSGYSIMTTGRFRVSGTGATSIYWSQIFWANDGVHCVIRNAHASTTANVQVIIGVIFKKNH